MRGDAHFQQILRFFSDRLTEGDAAVDILERIIRGKREPDRPTLAHAQLKLSGLVKPNRRSELVIRNRIYARLFDRQWLRSLAPKKKVVWLRRYAVAASIVVLLAGGRYVYFRGYLQPRAVARDYQRKLQTAALLRDAKEYRAILAGERPDPVTGMTLSGYGRRGGQRLPQHAGTLARGAPRPCPGDDGCGRDREGDSSRRVHRRRDRREARSRLRESVRGTGIRGADHDPAQQLSLRPRPGRFRRWA